MKKMKKLPLFFIMLVLGNLIFAGHFLRLQENRDSGKIFPPLACYEAGAFDYERSINNDEKLVEAFATLDNGIPVIMEVWRIHNIQGHVVVLRKGSAVCPTMRIYKHLLGRVA